MDKGVVKLDSAVMSELTPLAAAPKFARASAAVPALVPPRASDTTPDRTSAAYRPGSPQPSPLKLPTKLLNALRSRFQPVNWLESVSDAPPRLASALGAVSAPVPP